MQWYSEFEQCVGAGVCTVGMPIGECVSRGVEKGERVFIQLTNDVTALKKNCYCMSYRKTTWRMLHSARKCSKVSTLVISKKLAIYSL